MLAALLAAAACPLGAQTRDPGQHFFQPLLGDLAAELAPAAKAGRKGVLLVYEMDECPFCERFHRTVLAHARVQEWFQRYFVIFRIDVRGAAGITGFDGREQPEAAFAATQRVRATPTSVFHDLSGREIARFTGPSRDADEFLLFGEYVLSAAPGGASFADFRRARGR